MVEGLNQFRKFMYRTVPDSVNRGARLAMEQSAEEMVSKMQSLVSVRDGHLRDSIGWTWGPPPEGAFSYGQVRNEGNTTEFITVYAGSKKAYYARFIEFGTIKAFARPFFFPTYRALKSRAFNRIKRAIRKEVAKL